LYRNGLQGFDYRNALECASCSFVVLVDRGGTLAKILRCSFPCMTTSFYLPSSTAAYCRQLYVTFGHSFGHCAWRSSIAQYAMVWQAYATPGTADHTILVLW
jgi:hypothetical protein